MAARKKADGAPAKKKTAKKPAARKTREEPASRGLLPVDTEGGSPPNTVRALEEAVVGDGGAVLCAFREPLGAHWQVLASLPIDRVQPTPFQRDLSDAHAKRLTQVIDRLDRFLDPLIAVRADGAYWTPNGSHRLEAMRRLGARAVVALLIPESEVAYQILALNTEKAHNLKEKSLEVLRMARSLAGIGDPEESLYADQFEDPAYLTLGLCYESRPRFSGGAYHPILKRIEAFLGEPLSRALEKRQARRDLLLEVDDAVQAAVKALKEAGFESPYLKAFVVARTNPIRFRETVELSFEEVMQKMKQAALRFEPSKVSPGQIAGAGGTPDEE